MRSAVPERGLRVIGLSYKMATLPSLISQGISLMEGGGTITDFLQSQDGGRQWNWFPHVDVDETSDTIFMRVLLAGVKSETIDVDFYNNLVSVRGNRTNAGLEGSVCLKKEIQYGEFERKISIPISVTSRESVSMDMRDGVLYIRIDKTREEQNRFTLDIRGARVEGESVCNQGADAGELRDGIP